MNLAQICVLLAETKDVELKERPDTAVYAKEVKWYHNVIIYFYDITNSR